MLKFKRLLPALCAAVLMTTVSGCSFNKDIHQKIHDRYYSMNSYTAECELTVVSNKNKTAYDLTCNYNSNDESWLLCYDDIEVLINGNDKSARITNGNSEMVVPVKDEDMLIVINTFFKSYYEGEESMQKTSGTSASGTTLLKCTLMTPSKYGTIMKLWIDNKSVLPVKLQVTDDEDNAKLEVVFKSFKFVK